MEKIAKVTTDDLKRVGPKYLAPLFDASLVRVSVCCHPTKVEEICNQFKEYVFQATSMDSGGAGSRNPSSDRK